FVPLTLEVPQLGRRNAPPLALAPFAPGPNVHERVSLGQELHQLAPCIEPTMDGERHFSIDFDQGGKPSRIKLLAVHLCVVDILPEKPSDLRLAQSRALFHGSRQYLEHP